jgi:hypothetical protein
MKHSVAPGMALATDERRASHLRDVATELASLGGLTTRLIHFDVVGSETFAPSVQL